MYRLVERYAVSYKAGGASDVSAAHCAEVLNRILRQLERDHGVKVGENALSGLTPAVLDDYYNQLAARCKMTTHKLPNEKAVPKWERKEKYMTMVCTYFCDVFCKSEP